MEEYAGGNFQPSPASSPFAELNDTFFPTTDRNRDFFTEGKEGVKRCFKINLLNAALSLNLPPRWENELHRNALTICARGNKPVNSGQSICYRKRFLEFFIFAVERGCVTDK